MWRQSGISLPSPRLCWCRPKAAECRRPPPISLQPPPFERRLLSDDARWSPLSSTSQTHGNRRTQRNGEAHGNAREHTHREDSSEDGIACAALVSRFGQMLSCARTPIPLQSRSGLRRSLDLITYYLPATRKLHNF